VAKSRGAISCIIYPVRNIYFDSHAHLTDRAFDADRAEVISRAQSAGVKYLTEIACSPDDWENALALATRYPGEIFCALGIHPQECQFGTAQHLARLESLLKSPLARAVGEMGLDYARNEHPREAQLELFHALLETARRAKKPVVLHCRNPFPGGGEADAYADAISILKPLGSFSAGKFAGIFHCFSGNMENARAALDMGYLLGIPGTVTYPKNSLLRDVCKMAGVKNLVVETDCPYLPPQSARGKRNDPSFIPEICAALAASAGVCVEEAARATLDNALSVYSSPA